MIGGNAAVGGAMTGWAAVADTRRARLVGCSLPSACVITMRSPSKGLASTSLTSGVVSHVHYDLHGQRLRLCFVQNLLIFLRRGTN